MNNQHTPSGVLHKYVPSNFNNSFGLAKRLFFHQKPEGRKAMLYSLLGIIFTPLDITLSFFEHQLYKKAGSPKLPQIFVCGAPRSGTTIAGQLLIKYLRVYFFNNLTSLFPRSPIMAMKLFGWLSKVKNDKIPLSSFYGRTRKLGYPNDALYIWDRWRGGDRKKIPQQFDKKVRTSMLSFFGALEEHSGRIVLNKNNSLNTFAHLVAEILPNAFFICMDRDPLYLAQSHYTARKFIHGDENVAYGIHGSPSTDPDPIRDIVNQIQFHIENNLLQQELIGSDRFIILPYEDFCKRPDYWVNYLSQKIVGQPIDEQRLEAIRPLALANKRKIDEETFERIKKELIELNETRS